MYAGNRLYLIMSIIVAYIEGYTMKQIRQIIYIRILINTMQQHWNLIHHLIERIAIRRNQAEKVPPV